MNVIKLILRPCEENNLNNPTIISDVSNLPSPIHQSVYSPHPQRNSLSILTLKNKMPSTTNEFTVDYVPSLLLSSRSKTSNLNVLANNTMTSMDNAVKIIDLKIYIANLMNIRPDMLNLYIPCNNNTKVFQVLADKDNFCVCTNANTTDVRTTTSPNYAIRMSSSRSFENFGRPTILYFKVSNDKQRIAIDIFQNKIDKIILDVSPFCSIYMLKGIINQKLNSNNKINFASINSKTEKSNNNYGYLPMSGKIQTIYGAGFVENNNSLTKALSNKKFNDNDLIENIVSYYQKNNKKQLCTYNNESRILSLILIENTNKKCLMGLDFRFNYMRNFKRIKNFDDSAPSFREVSDGLNLVIYCMNPNCDLNNKYFIVTKGYDTFDIFSVMYSIRCPKCKESIKELRSIGMINAKWTYKGLLKGKKESKFEGDGFTLENNKLFALPEIQFLKQFSGLLIEVKEYKNPHNINEAFDDDIDILLDEDNILNEDDYSDLDGIDLYYSDNKKANEDIKNCGSNTNNTSIQTESFALIKRNSNMMINYSNIDIVNNDEIMIEGKDNEFCISCDNKLSACVIF